MSSNGSSWELVNECASPPTCDHAESLPPKTMPIAIIGISCRFPGNAKDTDTLWDLCVSGRGAWSQIPKGRFNNDAWYHPDDEHVGTSFVKGGYFLSEDVSKFDASFFNLSSEIAGAMDPEVRMLLECAYEAFESAGLTIEDVTGSNMAVCAGTCFRDFHDSHLRDPSTLSRFYLTGNGMAMISNRVSHFFDLKGPSIAVDTGCSTTLTLLHLACQSLRTGDAEMAMVGGSNALINPDMFISGTILGLLSPEGKCFAFDSRASGYGRGEGAAALILKPLEAAVRDGDPIRAVIRETALNQDGKTPTLTSPSRTAQEELMRKCYDSAGLDPRNTGYVEAHGTGTQAGDTSEAAAIGTILGTKLARGEPVAVGSIKTHIGHTEASSGLAGVISAVMAIEKGHIPPNPNFEQPNPNIPFEDLNIKETSVERWPESAMRRASVNNFGYGGSNAHAIIEHADYLVPYYRDKLNLTKIAQENPPGRLRILKVSAKSESSTISQLSNIQNYLKNQISNHGDVDIFLDRLVYTLGQKRSTYSWSSAISFSEPGEIIDLESVKPQRATQIPRIGFVFSGQGAQWYAMGRELIATYPVFRGALQEADSHLQELGASWSLIDEMCRDEKTTRINEVIISLPSCVAIQLALVKLLQSWGIEPAGVTSHSSGEVAAAFTAGVIDMKAALAIVYTRGSLTTTFQKLISRQGGMIAAGLSREEVKPYIDSLKKGQVVIACINSPSSVTISGDLPAIEEIQEILSQKDIFVRRLRVDAAYHSHHMLGIADAYYDALSKVLPGTAGFSTKLVYSSPVTGNRLFSATEISSPAYWVKNMVQPVEFLGSLTNLCLGSTSSIELSNGSNAAPRAGSSSVDILLEVGPHATLQGPTRQVLSQPSLKGADISYLSCLRRGQDAVSTMHSMVCSLLERGYPVSLDAVNFPQRLDNLQVLTDLPPYPWNHQVSHWVESRVNKTLRNRKFPVHDLLGTLTLDSHRFAQRWRHIIRLSEMPWLRDHQVQSDIVYPGAGYISMAIEACRQAHGRDQTISTYQIRRVDIIKVLVIPETTNGVEVQVSLQPCSSGTLESGWHQFQILSVDESDTWNLHCEGQILIVHKAAVAETVQWTDTSGTKSKTKSSSWSLPLNLDVQDFYGSLRRMGLNHGPLFRNITSIHAGAGKSSCEFEIADSGSTMPFHFQQDHILHPTTLDSVFQAVYTTLTAAREGRDVAMLPRSIRSMSISQDICTQPATSIVVASVTKKLSSRGFESDATVSLAASNDSNEPMLEIKGLFCQSFATTVQSAAVEESKICFTTVWGPDINLLSTRDLHHLISTGTPVEAAKSETDFNALLNQEAHASNGSPEDKSTEDVVRTVLRYLTHKRRHPQVLELGATSGYITKTILDFLDSLYTDNSAQLAHYTLADISSEDLIAAQENFSEYSDLLSTKQVKLERSYATQDLILESYDLVLMQADDIESNETFNVQELVKPGGILLVFDSQYSERNNKITSTQLYTHFEPLEFDMAASSMRLTLATRHEVSAPALPSEVTVLHSGPAPSQEWLKQLEEAIDSISGSRVTIERKSLTELGDARERNFILLDDPDRSTLMQPSNEEFEAIKRSLVDAKGVLWVSKGGAINCEHPSAGIHTGLLRTLRCEYPFKRYVSLDLEVSCSGWQVSDIPSICKVFNACFDYSPSKRGTPETEFAARKGLITIPRVVEDAVENASITNCDRPDETLPFFNSDRKIRLGVRKAGLLDSLVFVDDETTAGQLPPDYVQIRPAAFGLNFRDVMVAMGQLDETRMGFECSGFISAIGSEAATLGFKIGEPVYAFLRGYFANNIRVHHTSVAKVPEGMDMETAASVPLVFITAYQSLHNMARLKKGETILIHSGTGGVGQAAIMLAQLAGAEVFVTVGSREKQQFLVSSYGVPEDHIFNSHNLSFVEGIMVATKGKGIDVVLNSLAGPLLAATWNCIAPFGRFIEIGKRDLELNNSLEMGPFVRSVSFASLDLITLGELRGDDIAQMLVHIDALLREGRIRSVSPITKFQMSEAEKAFRLMQGGKHMGKIVLVPSENELVKVVPSSKSVELSSNYTYLIVGGLGGIGRSITRWMVERGARNLILLSRNAKSADETTSRWLQTLQERGARILVEACDVANTNQLAASLQRLQAQLPPIKGVIQAAMVLRDTLFDNMKLSDYETAVRPKVQGSWNLHRLLPADLDFFVMLSSISGFGGNATQANYAAGGTFQDALARHRVAVGQAAVSIDLGMVKGIGAMAGAEAKKTASRIERMGIRALSEDQVLRLVEASLRPNRDVASSQIITGIPPAWIRLESDNPREVQSTNAFWIRDPRFSPLETSSRESKDVRLDNKANLVAMLSDVSIGNQELTVAVSNALRSKLASMFIMPEIDIDTAAPPARLGVDSLIAVELRNWISVTMHAECSVFDILQTPSLDFLAEALVRRSPMRPNGEKRGVAAKLVDGAIGHV